MNSRDLENRIIKLEKKVLYNRVTNVTWDDFLDKKTVNLIRNMVANKLKDTSYISNVKEYQSYNDGNDNFITMYCFTIESNAEEWDGIEEYSQDLDEMGGSYAYCEAKNEVMYVLFNNSCMIDVITIDDKNNHNILGTYMSAAQAANAIVQSRQ